MSINQNLPEPNCTFLIMALTLEAIWHLRNQVVHGGEQIKIHSVIKNPEMRVRESLMAFLKEERWNLIEYTHWHRPPNGVIKLNVDVAISKEFTTLAVVARDENGQILNAWAKEHILCDPLQAEAAALFWAVQLAFEKDFKYVIIEGDSKICIDALNGNLNSVNWSISSLVCNITELCKYFSSCSFFWTRREANGVAHSLAKAASSLRSPFFFSCCCNSSSLPSIVWNA
jgi:ribonuclease HI